MERQGTGSRARGIFGYFSRLLPSEVTFSGDFANSSEKLYFPELPDPLSLTKLIVS